VTHYARKRYTGDVQEDKPLGRGPSGTALERFHANVCIADDGCWNWLAATSANGYSTFKAGGRQTSGHRWAYEQFVGPISAGLQIDHLCSNKRCVNPNHLEAVTPSVNTQRARDRDRCLPR
jgi:hypothetical protein